MTSRDDMVAAAREMTLENGWAALRMGALAKRIGVSRQTLHTQFGTKDGLGRAIVQAEAQDYFSGIVSVLGEHSGDVAAGIREAVTYTLRTAQANPLLQEIIAGRAAADESLLPELTTRGGGLLRQANTLLGEWIAAQTPDLDKGDAVELSDVITRLTLSHAVLPDEPPAVVGDQLFRLTQIALESLTGPTAPGS